MSGWDAFTWLCSFALGASAMVIFAFFLRDARSILNRDMHRHDEEDESASASETTPGTQPPAPPADRSR